VTYIDGFLIPVPTAKKADFIAHASKIDPVFIEHGARRVVECWGEDVPHGKTTDFYRAVDARDDETIVFSWIEWPDKAMRDAMHAKADDLMRTDPRVSREHNPLPFDGQRMIFGGFEPIFASGRYRRDAYVQGFVLPAHDRDGYRKMAAEAWPLFAEYGALQVVETWQEDVPEGKQTDFFRSVKTEPGEQVVFSWMLWPSRDACDAAAEKMQSDERMKAPPEGAMPFDPQRMIHAGFLPVVELGE
jgi:uncharacterized protein YbaA (DUF1428 family)